MKKVIKLNHTDLEVIFDVLNVYDPNDISHVYPEMGERKFMSDVSEAWVKVLKILKQTDPSNSTISWDYTADKKRLDTTTKN